MRCYLLLILLSACAALSGQTLSYTHYDTKDGLAGSVVYCAAEDKDGFLWFGTETGLSRFDGTHFHTFTTADGLPDNEILKLFVDSKNRVWVIPFRNAVCYFSRGRLYTQDNDPALHSLSLSADINTIQEDKYGNVIMAERSVIHIINPGQTTKNITELNGMPLSLPAGSGLNSDSVLTFFTMVSSGVFEQFTWQGSRFLGRGKKILHENTVNTTLYSPGIDVFLEDKSLAFYSRDKKLFSLGKPENFISISKIDDSLFTLNTTDGSILYDVRQKKEIAHFLEDHSINAATRDSEGNFWLMSAGDGVFRVGSLSSRNPVFREKNEKLSVTCIQKIGASLYIGTEHGTVWKTDSLLQQFRKKKLSGYARDLGRVMAIKPVNKNTLLLGTDGGSFLLEGFAKSRNLGHVAVKSIMACNETFLVGTTTDIFRLHCRNMKMDILWIGRVTCAWEKDSVVYVGTIGGLYTLTGNKKAFPGDAWPVFKNRIVDIKSSPDGTVWIATCGQGIAGYKNNKLVYTLTEKDGLTSNICRTIFIAGADIWLGTDKGLNRIRKEAGHFLVTKFSNVDGLGSDIINTVYVDNTNVYVGSANGLTSFNTETIKAKSFCNLRVIAIRAMDRIWNYDTSGLVLPHRQNSIQVEFAGISFRSAGDITYRYRLKGLSDTWQTTRATYLSYPTLPSGKYELQLTATNKFGVQSNPLYISFTVEKLLWEKTGFIILAAAILGSLFWLFVTLRIRALHAQNEEKLMTSNRMTELEQMALKAQMNPHFIFNSLNSIQKYVIEKDIKGANKFITDFSRLIRLTLEISTQAKISIGEEIKYITTYLELEKARFGHVFNYTIQSDPAIDRLSWHIPPMVLQPYVENSIRHGVRYREDNEGIIAISFIKKDPHLVCVIEDNGIGRKRARHFKSLEPIEYQSRGMALTARRMEMINKTRPVAIVTEIEDLGSEPVPAGTRITIYFPLQNVINSNV